MPVSQLAAMLRRNPIAVTGMGAFSACGDTVEKLWATAVAGQSTAARRLFHNGSESAAFATCSAPDIDISRAELRPLRKLDRCVQMAWLAADAALKQANLENAYSPERIGVVVGSSRGPLGKRSEGINLPARCRPSPSLAADSTFASISGAICRSFRFEGPTSTLSATCASAALAISNAAEQILLGKADAMLVGGTEAPLQRSILEQLDSAGVLGFHEDPSQTCRPFDVHRNGLVLGEGSGFLVLESAESALKRGALPLAQLLGWGYATEISGRTGVSVDGSGSVKVMEQALQVAELASNQIDYINLHGTGTKLNDSAEAQALINLFGTHVLDVPCSSTKPITGHCLGATPALEAILSVEALRHQLIPPSAHCVEQDPLCPIKLQTLIAKPATIKTAMSNSLGFWGYHASLIFSNVVDSSN